MARLKYAVTVWTIAAGLGGCAGSPDPVAWQPWPDADRMMVATRGGTAEVRARYAGLMAVEIQAASEPEGLLGRFGLEPPADIGRAVDIVAIVYCGRGGLRPDRSAMKGEVLVARYDCRVDRPAHPLRRPAW